MAKSDRNRINQPQQHHKGPRPTRFLNDTFKMARSDQQREQRGQLTRITDRQQLNVFLIFHSARSLAHIIHRGDVHDVLRWER